MREKRTRGFWKRRVLGIVVAACILLASVFAVDYLATDSGEIRRGVEAGGIDLGGMEQAEAREAIARRASTALGEIWLVNGEEKIRLPEEELGVEVDADAAAEEAYAVGRSGGIVQRVSDVLGSYLGGGVRVAADVRYDEEAARDAIANVAREFDREPKDAAPAVAESGKIEVREGEEGRILDQEGTLSNLDRALAALDGEVALVAKTSAPEVTTEEARAVAPDELVGEFQTDFAWDPDPGRQANLKMASGAIDGTLLAPGEVFSANELLAPLDYEAAKVFADGGVAYEEGGGLCQVSSTLYMAVNYAGLEIVERSPHYAELPYIQPGFDATVWFGAQGTPELDMKFKNTTDGYVLVREFVDADGFLVAQVFAQEPTSKNVVMNTEKIDQDPQEGIKWVTSKKVTGPDGEVLFDDMLYESVYSFNPPVPEEMKHETNDPRTAGWLDPQNTTGWAEVD